MTTSAIKIAEKLGGARTLGRPIQSLNDLRHAVEDGLPVQSLNAVASYLSENDVDAATL